MSVSIVMATYNREKFLPIAIESVLAQTRQDFELVVVDDGSTDATPDILARYARQDTRIIALRQKNSGVSVARNLGLARCSHDLVAMADDDDVSLPNRLEIQTNYLDANPDKSAVFGHALIIDEAGATIGRSRPEVDFDLARRLRRPDLALNVIHGAAMIRKAAVLRAGGYRSPMLEDRDLFGRMWTSGERVGVVPVYIYSVRRHGRNVSRDLSVETLQYGDFIDHNALRRLEGLPEINFEAYRAFLNAAPLLQRVRRSVASRARFAYDLATLHYSQRRLPAALGYALTAAALNPSRVATKVARKLVWRT